MFYATDLLTKGVRDVEMFFFHLYIFISTQEPLECCYGCYYCKSRNSSYRIISFIKIIPPPFLSKQISRTVLTRPKNTSCSCLQEISFEMVGLYEKISRNSLYMKRASRLTSSLQKTYRSWRRRNDFELSVGSKELLQTGWSSLSDVISLDCLDNRSIVCSPNIWRLLAACSFGQKITVNF